MERAGEAVKCGVPPAMLSVIKSLHDDMLAQVRVGGDLTTDSIEVKNGLRQGCTLAPSLSSSAVVGCTINGEVQLNPSVGVRAQVSHVYSRRQ